MGWTLVNNHLSKFYYLTINVLVKAIEPLFTFDFTDIFPV